MQEGKIFFPSCKNIIDSVTPIFTNLLTAGHHVYWQISDAILFLVILIVYDDRRGKLAIELLDELLQRCDGVVVARFDLYREDVVSISDGWLL